MYQEWTDTMWDILIELYQMGSRNAVALACAGLADVMTKQGVPIQEIDDFLNSKYTISVKQAIEVEEEYTKGKYGETCK